jgi:hypothetical protein
MKRPSIFDGLFFWEDKNKIVANNLKSVDNCIYPKEIGVAILQFVCILIQEKHVLTLGRVFKV